jgi:hypothetical protein
MAETSIFRHPRPRVSRAASKKPLILREVAGSTPAMTPAALCGAPWQGSILRLRSASRRMTRVQCAGPTSVFCTQPLKLDESTWTKPFFWSPLAISSSVLVSVASTLLSLDGPL